MAESKTELTIDGVRLWASAWRWRWETRGKTLSPRKPAASIDALRA